MGMFSSIAQESLLKDILNIINKHKKKYQNGPAFLALESLEDELKELLETVKSGYY